MTSHATLGKYHLLERLASDEIAEVYKVKTIGIAGFEKVQVLKRVMPGCAQDPKFIRAFIDEAKIAFSLNHRNIVQVFEFGKVDGDLFLAMEYIPGANLHELMLSARRQRKLCPVGLTCYLMGEVAAGLEYSHRKTDHFGQELSIVHCDIRPRNIACSFEGSVKILDFGISRAVWHLVAARGLTNWDLRYLSPEQIQGGELDARSDLFSFGIILWELLTGLPLFEGTSPEEIRRNILQKPISPPATINPDVPAHLDDLTMHCLVRDPTGRIASASDLQMELHRIQRMLGAVIGSRALSAYIDDLLPDYNDARDVRQEGPEERAAPEFRFERPMRSNELVDAAAELARPQNPPAEVVVDSRDVPYDSVRFAEPIPRRATREAEMAGVLRAGRHPDDVAVPRNVLGRPAQARAGVSPLSARQRAGRPLSTFSSDEVTAGPVPVEDNGYHDGLDASIEEITATPDVLAEVLYDTIGPGDQPAPVHPALADTIGPDDDRQDDFFDAEEVSLSDLLEPEDATTADPDDEQDTDTRQPFAKQNQLALIDDGEEDDEWAEETETPERSGHPVEWEEPRALERFDVDQGAPLAEAPAEAPSEAHEVAPEAPPATAPPARTPQDAVEEAQTLGEKKRFIACAVVLESDPGAMGDARTLVADIAYKFEGILHDEREDRLVVLFGLPTTDEHDIVEAVRFALDAQDALTGLASSLPEGASGVGARIAIRAGTARMSGASVRGYQPLGNTLSEAEALALHAQAGQTVVAGVAARLASQHYVLRGIKPFRRHGKQVRSYRVLAPRSRALQRTGPDSALFVGREVELKAIRSEYREAVLRGSQRAVLAAGEPGIGKSRLVDEFIARQSSEAHVISASATPHRRGTPYALLVDLVRAATGVWSGSSTRAAPRIIESLRRLMSDSQQLEALESLIVPRERPTSEGGSFSVLGVHRAMRGLLNHLVAQRPLIVMLEDLHWSDHASVDCLSQLVGRPEETTGPILFLMTIRPDEEQVPESLFAGSSFLLIEELHETERRRLIEEELGDRADDALVHEVERRAGGNPFYIRELSRALQELNASGATEVPATVQGVVAGRVDRLPAAVKSLLQHAAVIGPTFREGILAQLIGRNPARSLAVLRNRGIIVAGLRTAAPNPVTHGKSEQFEREWAFRHVLIQEVVYDAISNVARRDLHLRVGEIMAKRVRRGSSDPPGEVARHLELGGKTAEAGAFYLQAANKAAVAFASREALELYDKALGHCHEREREYAIYAGRERAHAQLGMHAEQASDLEALERLAGDDLERVADLENRKALHLLRLGEFYRALAAAEQAEDAATEAGIELARGEALQLRGEAYERLNDHARAIEAVTKALGIFEVQQTVPNQVRARIGLGRINLVQARYDEAFAQFDPALELIKETDDRWHERVLRYNLAVVHYCRGEFARALDEALYSLKLCEQFGDHARKGDNASVLGIIYLELGNHTLARRYLEAALAIHKETGSQWSEADTLVYFGLLEAAARRFQRALRALDRAKRIAGRIGAKYITVNARNATAWALCERGTTADAVRATDEATEAAELARQTRLIVGEIPGLSRSARATAMLGNLDAARALSRRAVELLEEQRIIESPEEEIYYTHFRILRTIGDPSAEDYLDLAYGGYVSKLNRLQDAEHRKTYSEEVRLNAAICADREAGEAIDDLQTRS
jgi:serine/threonine protein kinase/tetratricopeptide (TPR) repeat protein